MQSPTSKWTAILAAVGVQAVLMGSAVLAAPAVEGSEVNTPTGQTRQEVTHASATVVEVDRPGRSALLKTDDGSETWVDVPDTVKAFDKLKAGDKVDVDYYQSFAVSFAPSGTKPSASETKAGAVDLGAGIKSRELRVSARVVSVDAAANVVTFKGPKGKLRTVHVENPALQSKLPTLKPGQVVQFDYTEAIAADIRPSGAK
ncbi:MAG TPA: hypothetical protein VMT03_17660 [Polyangia bacterium]|nr:hypothetical protein [Polyangia bacterium]